MDDLALIFVLSLLAAGSTVVFSSPGQTRENVIANCSCYKFHPRPAYWRTAKTICQNEGAYLVSLETREEWQFMLEQIKNRTTLMDEWHIGLQEVRGTWWWESGVPLRADCNYTGCWPWQPTEPSGDRGRLHIAVMAKHWPENTEGLFNDMQDALGRGFICEQVKETCQPGEKNCEVAWKKKIPTIRTTTVRTTIRPTTGATSTHVPTTEAKTSPQTQKTDKIPDSIAADHHTPMTDSTTTPQNNSYNTGNVDAARETTESPFRVTTTELHSVHENSPIPTSNTQTSTLVPTLDLQAAVPGPSRSEDVPPVDIAVDPSIERSSKTTTSTIGNVVHSFPGSEHYTAADDSRPTNGADPSQRLLVNHHTLKQHDVITGAVVAVAGLVTISILIVVLWIKTRKRKTRYKGLLRQFEPLGLSLVYIVNWKEKKIECRRSY